MATPPTSAVRFALLDAIPNIRYVVTDAGRTSNSPFGNLSLSPNGITPDAIRNRETAASVLGTPLSQCIFMHQEHTNHVECVDDQHAGRGAYSYDNAIRATDGIATATPGLGLFALAADCQPILLYAPDVHAVAAIHCGWRGTLLNMPQNAVRTMQKRYGARAESLIACLAPCIGAHAFEIHEDVASLFRNSGYNIPLLPHPDPEKFYINLPLANSQLLLDAGLCAKHIEISPLCTYSSWPQFYSARRGDKARFAAGITLLPPDQIG